MNPQPARGRVDTKSAEVGAMVNREHFRHVLSQYPTGVAVVTALTMGGEPTGMTVGSFASVSMEPPLVSFMPSKTSASWASMQPLTNFCVNVLGAHQDEVCRLIASRKQDKFAGLDWHMSRLGNPVLTGCVATIECARQDVFDGGDHDIVLGRVRELSVEHPTLPLLFFRGGYGSFQPGPMLSGEAELVDHMRAVHLVRQRLADLATEVNSEVTTIVRLGDEVVVTSSYGASSAGELASRVGYRAPFVPPLGSVHAAWGSDALRERWLGNLGADATAADRMRYLAMLDDVRDRGYATSVTSDDRMDALALEMSHGRSALSMSVLRQHIRAVADEYDPTRTVGLAPTRVRGIMAPVFGARSEVAFLVMIWGDLSSRLEEAELARRGSVLRAAADEMTAIIGGAPA
ncbi:flavin reductase [Amycolatopsis pigmentata]|uniref:Flavin reductase n=1 Tax=Amycolatopsis pigmentata TaxID=450801 RepID=A0ABW5FLH9_9PSEU